MTTLISVESHQSLISLGKKWNDLAHYLVVTYHSYRQDGRLGLLVQKSAPILGFFGAPSL